MNLAQAPGWVLELLERERVGRLGFLDADDKPRVLPVTFSLFEGAVWSAIDRKRKRAGEPARARYLRRRPDAALLVDVYDDDWARLRWAQLVGSVEVLAAAEQGRALAALAAKYPQYREAPPPGPVLRLTIARATWWRAAG